jgi:hypothetical protein
MTGHYWVDLFVHISPGLANSMRTMESSHFVAVTMQSQPSAMASMFSPHITQGDCNPPCRRPAQQLRFFQTGMIADSGT